jgi:hypothetical protein
MTEPIKWARDHMSWPQGYCLQWVRSTFSVAPLYASASDAWREAKRKHPTNSGKHCPRNVPVWWTGGSQGFGHVALSVGNGFCLSTDAGGAGKCAKVEIDELTRRWGLDFKGWTEDINDKRVYDPHPGRPAAGWEKVKLSALRPKEHNKDIEVVKRRLHAKLGDKYDLNMDKLADFWGDHVTDAYKAWQERLGFTGKDADGKPGRQSLEKLGLTVVD